MNKKILALITTMCVSVNFLLIPNMRASAENISFPVSYNFEDGYDGWQLDTSKEGATLDRLTESDNSFLRLSAKEGNTYRAKDKIEVIPNGYFELPSPYIMEPESKIAISVDIRTNNNKFMRNFYLNREQLNADIKSEVQYNFATLWSWKNNNSISVFDGVYTQSIGGYLKTKSTTLFDTALENDKWYNFKTFLYTDEMGLPEFIQLFVTNNGDINLQSEKLEIKNQTLRLSNKITRLDFAMGNIGVTLDADATFDIDNVMIYTETDERFWKLNSQNEGNIFGNVDTLKIAFSGEMQETSLNPDNIKLYDSANNEILYEPGYDHKKWEYSITPSDKLTDGEYSIFVNTENVNGLRHDKSVIQGMSDECEQKVGFVVFSGNLPEVKNFSIKGKNIPFEKLEVSGEYYQSSGIEGYLKYQWWYSSELNGDYVKIENETSNVLIVPEGFSDKYIKVSVIPTSNTNIIRGKEIFSEAVLPVTKPTVKNLKVTGRNAKGDSLNATGMFYQEDGLDGEIEYQWWYSINKDGVYNEIENAVTATFTVPDSYLDKFIKVSATAVSQLIGAGDPVFSEVICPQTKPYAQNVNISGIAVEGMEVVLEYVFVDDNNDDEGESLFEWFISDTGTDNWNKIEGETTKSYTIKNDDIGKYIKAQLIPVSTYEPYIGSVVQSSNILGPITSLGSINLVENSGFEDGTNTGWNVRRMGGDDANVEATKEDAYSGEWCGRFSGQTQNATFMTYGVRLQENIRYLQTCMMKVAADSSVDNVNIVFYGEGNPKVSYEHMEQTVINKSKWTRVSQLISVEGGGLFSEMPQYWANGTTGYISYIDDFYVAPLIVADIMAEVPERISIPASGTNSADITIFEIHNQIGTTLGFDKEKAYWEIDNDVKGVYVKDNKLYVTCDAVSGTLNLKAVCEPQFDGAIQSRFTKNYPVELVTNDNKTPRINSIKILGDTSNESTLKLEYDFYQVDGCADMSNIKWYVSDSLNGEYREVQGSGKDFNITGEYIGCYIKAEVIPIDGEGRKGQMVTSNIAGPKTAPVAENVSISGKGYVGDVIKSQYTYYDFNGDKEGITKFQWMRADSENGEYKEIIGATEQEYTISTDDVDCWIKLRVTPVSEKQPFAGNEVSSNAIKGPRAPRAEDVAINVSGKVLTGKYKYVSDNGVAEGNTICQWLVDGNVVATGARYEVGFTGTKNVEFKVTPVALSAPYSGESFSVSKTVTGRDSGGSGGGGSGGGSGGFSMSGSAISSLTEALITPQSKTENEDISAKDIERHWSREYAEKVIKNGIMNTDSNGHFHPDKNVTRAEMIEYIFKAMNYTETEYISEFADVNKDMPYAKMLQTMVDKGIISIDTNFRPDDNVSREEVCKIISTALGLSFNDSDLDNYKDKDEIGMWALGYVNNVIKAGIMVGVSSDCFSPKSNITNGQIAKIIVGIMEENYSR